MNTKNIIKAKEIPYSELELVGLDKEALLDLPKNALDRILTGRTSPLLRLTVPGKDGKLFSLPAKIALERKENGEVGLMIFPVMKRMDNRYKLNEEDILRLNENETILRTIDRGKGKEKCYIQLDKETNTLMTARSSDIHIPDAIGDVTVGLEQKERMRNGEPVEVDMGDAKVTVGVDLNDRTGFKVLNGDLDEWRKKKLIEWDRITPGATGYWLTSENGWEYKKSMEEKEGVEEERSRTAGKGIKY